MIERTDKKVIWVIGDSTVSAFNDAYYYRRYGYGTQVAYYLDGTYDVINLAKSGRSAKSYILENAYADFKQSIHSGDIVIICFGHNDQKIGADIYSNANGDYKVENSFAKHLYDNYIKVAHDAGAFPILSTPIIRRPVDGVLTDECIHITHDCDRYEGGDYRKAILKLGTDTNTPTVDMTTFTKEIFEKMNPDEYKYVYAWAKNNEHTIDNVHTSIYGARLYAYLFLKEVKSIGFGPWCEHIQNLAKPVMSEVLFVEPDYVELDYHAPTEDSKLWKPFGIWKGTAFGDLSGDFAPENFLMEPISDNSVRIAVSNKKGKITNTSDGMALYYVKLPADKAFTLKADVIINSFLLDRQVSFGLIALDGILIDTHIKNFTVDYVAAAPLHLNNLASGEVLNGIGRQYGEPVNGGNMKQTLKENARYALSIVGDDKGYVCKFGDEEPVCFDESFRLNTLDEDFIYVGVFVARQADVTFENIELY